MWSMLGSMASNSNEWEMYRLLVIKLMGWIHIFTCDGLFNFHISIINLTSHTAFFMYKSNGIQVQAIYNILWSLKRALRFVIWKIIFFWQNISSLLFILKFILSFISLANHYFGLNKIKFYFKGNTITQSFLVT